GKRTALIAIPYDTKESRRGRPWHVHGGYHRGMKIVAAGAVAALAAVLIVTGPSREAEAVSEDVPPASNAQLSALQELVTQLRQENDQLEHIDEQLSSARRASADEELSRDEEVQSQAARHTATVQALETLRQVDALLEIGDSDGVDDQLARAEAALARRLHRQGCAPRGGREMAMRSWSWALAVVCLISCSHASPASEATPVQGEAVVQETAGQLQQLVAPIALYPDALIAQVLAASTY